MIHFKVKEKSKKMKIKMFFFWLANLLIITSINYSVQGQQNDWIAEIALQEGVHPTIVYALINQESSFRPQAVSPKGAIGLMQLMPETARRFNVNPFNMQENVRGGCRYLRFLLIKFGGRLDLALAGYNAGENAVIKYGYNIPPFRETKNYVAKILKSLNISFNLSQKSSVTRISKSKERTNKSHTSEKSARKDEILRKTSSSFLF